MRIHLWSFGLALLLAPALVGTTPARAAAQECWTCNYEQECVKDDFGVNEPCDWGTLCDPFDPESCWFQCNFGGGGFCEPAAVAMSGQIVFSVDPDSPEAGELLANLTFDAQARVYRRTCDQAVVHFAPSTPPSTIPANPAPRVVLR